MIYAILSKKGIIHDFSLNIQHSVSIIICAKNESENLKKNLPFILEQNYPDFEVIIVDDGSDERLTINPEINSGQANERLTIINLSKEEKIGLGKKYALQKGVEAAKNKLILLTDADCQPVSKNWISEMASCVTNEKKIVLGISPYSRRIGFLNSLIEYETAQTALQYIGFALLGNPYMSVGRNVLYDAALLKSKTWSGAELSIASGDDDLMIQSLATKENTAVCLSKESYTISEPKKTWKEYIKQKLRHYESGNLYKLSHRLLLGSYLLSKLYIYIFVYSFFFFKQHGILKMYLNCFIVYCLFITFCNYLLHRKQQLNLRWITTVFNDILYCIFTITLGLISLLKPTKNWK
ncbi:MAG: glycosyltransferase [Chitinophagales bacterium]